jgi:hypothetical protein
MSAGARNCFIQIKRDSSIQLQLFCSYDNTARSVDPTVKARNYCNSPPLVTKQLLFTLNNAIKGAAPLTSTVQSRVVLTGY